jgi:hypothetical protein
MLNEKHLFKILEFPKHLQTTIVTLLKLGLASASEVSGSTGKARAVESAYLNQLVVMRVARKERKGREAVFSVDLEALDY